MSCQPPFTQEVGMKEVFELIAEVGEALHGLDRSLVIFPHLLSRPLDARQRLEFPRFHLDRHRHQIESLMTEGGFPPQARP